MYSSVQLGKQEQDQPHEIQRQEGQQRRLFKGNSKVGFTPVPRDGHSTQPCIARGLRALSDPSRHDRWGQIQTLQTQKTLSTETGASLLVQGEAECAKLCMPHSYALLALRTGRDSNTTSKGSLVIHD